MPDGSIKQSAETRSLKTLRMVLCMAPRTARVPMTVFVRQRCGKYPRPHHGIKILRQRNACWAFKKDHDAHDSVLKDCRDFCGDPRLKMA